MAQATQKHHRPTHQRRAVVFDPKAEIDALIIEPSLVPDLSFPGVGGAGMFGGVSGRRRGRQGYG